MADFAEWIWERNGTSSRLARAALWPASALFASIVARRNAHFDSAVQNPDSRIVRPTLLPAVSVGNLTVGGTGKTPIAAWCVQRLIAAGARPAVVLRGYGDDEWRVHSLLNPGVPIIVAPDRLDGIALARTRGASCVVLDDAFQHRQAARIVDIVLVSADRWTGRARLLPSGPFREPLSSLKRASIVVLTAKAADALAIAELESAVIAAAPNSEIVIVRLSLGALRLATTLPIVEVDGSIRARRINGGALLDRQLGWLSGRRIVAVCAIGDPLAFRRQLESYGANVTVKRFSDHHAFSAADANRIARDGEGTDGVVCTLKDAVKLAAVWPRVAPPLWYVSQSVVVERGAAALDRALARVLAVRIATASNAG